MAQTNTAQAAASSRPRFVKSAELLGVDVEIVYIDEVDGSEFGPEYLFDCRLPSGEVVSYTRHRDDWRARGVAAMRELLEAGEPVLATLSQPGKAILWRPYDLRGGSRVSAARAARLQAYGFALTADEDGPALRVDDTPPPTDADAPLFDE